MTEPTLFDFDGETYEPRHDRVRLNRQLSKVWLAMLRPGWHTLAEIEKRTEEPQASISARLRDLRKDRFGGHEVLRQRRGDPSEGLFEYRLIPSEAEVELPEE